MSATSTATPKVAKKSKSNAKMGAAPAPREGSVIAAVIEVLRRAQEPMSADEITARIQKRGLAPNLKGKTPVATVGARIAVEVKNGRYFERTAPGRFQLLKK